MKVVKYLMYYLVTAGYSALIGVVAWSFLFIVNTVTHFLWIGHEGEGAFMYDHKLLIIPFIWGVSMILAYVYSNYEVIPKPGIVYAKEFKQTRRVKYADFFKVYILAMIPLFLGSSVGPEAALVGLLFMLSSFIGDVTSKYEHKFGIDIAPNEHDNFLDEVKNNKLYLLKIVIIYVTVGFVLLQLLGYDKYPSFNVALEPIKINHYFELIEIIPLIAVGYGLGKFYQITEPLIEHQFEKISNQYIKMSITAGFLSLFAILFPVLIMSGEATLHILVEHSIMSSGLLLIGLSLLKVVITHICISGDLRGGHIFPIIYSAFLMVYGFSVIFDLDPTLAIAAVTAATALTIFSNTLAMFMLLALFFPVKLLTLIFIVILIFSERRAADNDQKEI
ncbi:hypothetical protein R2F61_03035 [Mollicutes bacterium LVI A0078]|nr:hypothetical protein RZE84_03065 [Mollicutes bacterium LVI A0075]WOO91540.1 hypothetical protein R2F61_03035 [Mollicutes bacterium LVI A0078]